MTSPNKNHAPRMPAREQAGGADHPPRTAAEQADPHGAAPADEAAKDEPTGRPTSDRHRMETAVVRQSGRRR